jgi:hypothetical protein
MKRFALWTLVAALAAVLVWTTIARTQDPIAAIDAAYAKRDGTDAAAKQSLALAEQVLAGNPNNYEAAWRAARSCFWVCDRTLNTDVKKQYGKRGWDWGLKAISLAPNRVEGYYYGVISMGEYGKGIGIPRALLNGLGGKYEEMCNKAIAINAAFDRGGPLRAMGRYFQLLPRLVRKLDKAEQYFKKSEALGPCMTRTRDYLVELYMEQENWAAARATAQLALNTAGCAEHAWECEYFKQQIRELQKKFPPQ